MRKKVTDRTGKHYYDKAIDFIAANDDPLEFEIEDVKGYTTVVLVSEIFSIDTETVARDIVRRRNWDKKNG